MQIVAVVAGVAIVMFVVELFARGRAVEEGDRMVGQGGAVERGAGGGGVRIRRDVGPVV